MVVDKENMCWYHRCVIDKMTGKLRLMPKRCGMGSKVSYHFISGFDNPCTYNFDSAMGKYR